MAVDIVLPQIGESMTEATIGRWLKQVGDRVERFEALVEVETDKVSTEVTSVASGVLLEIITPEGVTVPVGTLLARIGDDDNRPLLAGGDRAGRIHALLAQRSPAYAAIRHHVDTTSLSVEVVAERVMGIVAGLLQPGGRLYLREGHPVLEALDDKPADYPLNNPDLWVNLEVAVNTADGVRAVTGSAVIAPEPVERYLRSKFGDALEPARDAMSALAAMSLCSAASTSGRRWRSSLGNPAGISGASDWLSDVARATGPGLRPSRVLIWFSVVAIWSWSCGMMAAALASAAAARSVSSFEATPLIRRSLKIQSVAV